MRCLHNLTTHAWLLRSRNAKILECQIPTDHIRHHKYNNIVGCNFIQSCIYSIWISPPFFKLKTLSFYPHYNQDATHRCTTLTIPCSLMILLLDHYFMQTTPNTDQTPLEPCLQTSVEMELACYTTTQLTILHPKYHIPQLNKNKPNSNNPSDTYLQIRPHNTIRAQNHTMYQQTQHVHPKWHLWSPT